MSATKTKPSKWIAARSLAIRESGYAPGDRLSQEDVARLPVGRIETLARIGFVRRADDSD